MAQLVVAVAGAALGGFLAPGVVALGVTGAGLGFMAGSFLGSMFAPAQKSQGPRLGDLQVSGSAYGSVIPWVAGSPRIAGQVVWASTKRELANTQSVGKGGGKVKSTSYTYEVDLLILLTDNEIAGVSRIWSNGELVYDGTAKAGLWSRMTVYTGAASQLPDPDYEAAVGTANAPAYRGRGSVFIKSLQLGGGGQIPNLTFEACSDGYENSTPITYPGIYTLAPRDLKVIGDRAFVLSVNKISVYSVNDPNNILFIKEYIFSEGLLFNKFDKCVIGNVFYAITGGINYYNYSIKKVTLSDSLDVETLLLNAEFTDGGGSTTSLVVNDACVNEQFLTIVHKSYPRIVFFDLGSKVAIIKDLMIAASRNVQIVGPYAICVIYNGFAIFEYINILNIVRTIIYTSPLDVTEKYDSNLIGNNLYVNSNINGYEVIDLSNPIVPVVLSKMILGIIPESLDKTDQYLFIKYNTHFFKKYDLGFNEISTTDSGTGVLHNISVVGETMFFTVLTRNLLFIIKPASNGFIKLPKYLNITVEELLDKSNIIDNKYDTTAIVAITRPVRALAISQVSSARTVLEMLASAYNFEAVLSDKLHFRPRGGAPVATLTFDELGVATDSGAEPLPLTQANELEIPAQLAITYNNTDGDYQTDTQYSDRLLTGMESVSAITLPMGFTASEAKQMADTLLFDKAVSALSTTITLDTSRAAIEPTDVILITDEDTSTYRMRVTKRTDAGGITTLACVRDDSSVLTQAGVTTGGTTGQTAVAALATTTFALMDLPALSDAEDQPGIYVAVTGDATNWTGGDVYDSLDDVTYTQRDTLADQTAIGTCTTTLGDYTGVNAFDETNTLTVDVGLQQLVSVTWADIIASETTNAAQVGSELIQYRNATLVSAGMYTLSGFLRGRKGTESAMTGHAASEQFVSLGTTGLSFLPLQSSDLVQPRYYKVASAGQALSAVTAQTITPLGNTLKPFAPVHARVNRDSTDTVITWTRRTRLGTRIVGSLPMSIPLGETTESYEVEVWDSGYTTRKRTISAASATATYINAQQVTDFGSAQATLYLKIYQLSATVGRGAPLIVSI